MAGGIAMKNAKRRLSQRLMSTCLVPVICLGISLPVSAQMEEITVTATKREENVQDVPVAVTVLSSETIENAHAVGFEGLQALIPSVSYRKGNTTRNSSVIVRGLGTISFSTAAEPSVSTVVDGVVLGRSGQAFGDLYEVERLEVLRGPQGTLFGKNASAGVVNITTKKPSDEFTGSVDLQFYQDNETRLTGRVSGPLGDNARASATLFKGDFDGYSKNVFNNETTHGYDREGVRLMLDYDVSDSMSALFIYEDYDAVDECCADFEALPSGRHPGSEALPDSNGIVDGKADIDLDQRLIDHDLINFTLDNTTAYSVQIDAEIGDLTLTSITARRVWFNNEIREGDFTSIGGDATIPVDFGATTFQLHDTAPTEWRQVSEELRLASPGGETFDWQAGFFYWNIDSERTFTRAASCQNNGGQSQDILDANPGLTCNANDIITGEASFNTEFNNYALFGDATWNVSDQLRVLFGLRWTEDEVSFNHNRRNLDPFGRRGVGVQRSDSGDSDFQNKKDESNVSGKLGLQWDTDNLGMVYFTYSQGYKGPAFNTFFNMGAADASEGIDAEESDAFELGWKYTGDNFLVNFTVFQTDVDNYQANNFDVSTGVTITRLTNAGNVSTEGFEIDFLWQPTENISIGGGLASIEAEIDEFFCPLDPVTGLPPAGCDTRSGLDVPFSPDLKMSAHGQWVVPMDNMDLIFNGSYVYTDEQFSDLPNTSGVFNPAALLPDYTIINLSAALSFNDDQFRVTLIGKNLGDESYATTFSGDGFRYQIPRDADRYFGLGVRAAF